MTTPARCAAAVLVVALSGCTGAAATPDSTPTDNAPTRSHQPVPAGTTGPAAAGELTARQVAVAVAAAKPVVTAQHATVTSATATVGRGTVRQPNVGPPCTSGRVLHVTLIGAFPDIVVSGFFQQDRGGLGSTTVRAVLLTVDAESGRACLLAVQTGSVRPRPGATVLHLD